MKNKFTFKTIGGILKKSFEGFGEHKITKMSGALAYYTVFSMAPLLILVISLCGLFLGQEAVEGEVYDQLAGVLGKDTAHQMQEIIKNSSLTGKDTMGIIIGGITLLVGSTTVFAEIQDSINDIWGLKPKPKKGWLKMLKNRFLSFSVIVSLGFILLVSLGITAVIEGISDRLQAAYPDITVIVFYIFNLLLTLSIVSLIFAVIFKVLPDAIIKWRDVIAGALVTAVLFMIGRFAIAFYISQSDVGGAYGAAGSMVVLLLWTYYSSIILYFGAEFTKAYALSYGSEILPNHYAVTTKQVEIESDNRSIGENEKVAKAVEQKENSE